MYVETSRDGIKKRFILLTTCVKNVLRNVYSLDLNYDRELKIQGRVHSVKLRITVQTQVKLKWED